MSEKGKLIPIFLAIGCAGVVGMELAIMLATLIIEGPSEELGENALMLFAMFFWSILWGAIAYFIIKKKDIVNINNDKRRKVILVQLIIITTLIILLSGLLIVFIINKFRDGIIFSGAFIVALLFWEVGCILANKILKKGKKT